MMKLLAPISLLYSILLISCGNSSTKNSNETSNDAKASDSSGMPVETKKANSNYKPAFAGQTRIAGVKTTTAYEGKVLTDQLKSPWGITSLPDGRFLITERLGTMRIATTSGKLSAPITGIPPVNPGGQGGLLGLTIDPDFSKNRIVYWCFSQPLPEGNLTAVAKGKLSSDERRIENAKV